MELALIFVLELCGLVLGLALARVAFTASPNAAVRRVIAATERATRSFLGRALVRVAASATLLGALVLAVGFGTGRAATGVASAGGLALGALLGSFTAFGAAWLGNRAAAAALAGAASRFDLALGAVLRSAGATGVVAQALGVAGALGLLGAARWLHGAPAAGDAAAGAALALPGYALGAALVVVLLERSAGTYAAAARAGELFGLFADPSVARHDAKNPALVSSLVGERLEHGVAAARLFASSALAASAAALLGVALDEKGGLDTRVTAYPLLLWGFGLVANGAGLFVARALEAQGALPALARGQLSAGVVWLVGLLGGGAWLFPDSWPWLAGAGALGLVAGAAAPYGTARAFARRGGPLRDALDALGVGPAWAQAGAVGFGLGQAAASLAVIAVMALVAQRLGTQSGLPGGGLLAVMLALFGAMSWSPYALAAQVGPAIAETAQGVAAISGLDADTSARLGRLGDSSQVAAGVARTYLGLVHGLAALAGALALAGLRPGAEGAGGVPAELLGVAGVALVLGTVGPALRRASRAAREVGQEVERQLGSELPEGPGESRLPGYRACEELAGRVSMAGAGLETATLLVGPVLLGIALRLVYRGSGPRLAAEALATFVAGAAVTALGVALAVDGARAVLTGARRANRPDGDQKAHAASVTGSALAEILGSAAGPVACSAALIAASVALLARTFLP